jgi:hypothetical protein
MKITPYEIEELEADHIFVFGSNEAGIHGAGAANLAYHRFSAAMYQGFGLSGQSFAIPTKDSTINTLDLETIQFYINRFEDFVRKHPSLQYMITRIGCGLAGYTAEDIAPMFKNFMDLENIYLPEDFIEIINNLKLEK